MGKRAKTTVRRRRSKGRSRSGLKGRACQVRCAGGGLSNDRERQEAAQSLEPGRRDEQRPVDNQAEDWSGQNATGGPRLARREQFPTLVTPQMPNPGGLDDSSVFVAASMDLRPRFFTRRPASRRHLGQVADGVVTVRLRVRDAEAPGGPRWACRSFGRTCWRRSTLKSQH
jgi:hypothetical protein